MLADCPIQSSVATVTELQMFRLTHSVNKIIKRIDQLYLCKIFKYPFSGGRAVVKVITGVTKRYFVEMLTYANPNPNRNPDPKSNLDL